MELTNHNGAPFGTLENDDGYINFHPKKDWESGYSAYELEQIARVMRRIGK